MENKEYCFFVALSFISLSFFVAFVSIFYSTCQDLKSSDTLLRLYTPQLPAIEVFSPWK